MPLLTNFLRRLEGDWDVEPEQAWSAASESSLNPMSRLEDVSRTASYLPLCRPAYTRPLPLQFLVRSLRGSTVMSACTELTLVRVAMERLEHWPLSSIT